MHSMMMRSTLLLLLLVLHMPVFASAFGPGDSDTPTQVRVHRKVIVHCSDESEDCDQQAGDYTLVLPHIGSGAFLGVELSALTPELREHFGVHPDRGVMVSRVIDESAAFRAGIQAGDIITAIDGTQVSSRRDLIRAIMERDEGDAIDLELWRDRKSQTVTAILDTSIERVHHGFRLGCEEDDEDCFPHVARLHGASAHYDCDGQMPCKVEITCGDEGDCVCTANGEAVACDQVQGRRALGE